MQVTLGRRHRQALTWIAIWADREGQVHAAAHPWTRGALAAAAAIKPAPAGFPGFPARPAGRPAGQGNVGEGVRWDLPDEVEAPFAAAAAALGAATPQQGLRLLLERIWDAAPGIADGRGADETLAAIPRVFDAVNRRAAAGAA